MATTPEYLEFVLEQLPPLWSLRSRKMFGEYMIYLNDKPILTLCDNTVFVKKLPVLGDIMANSACGCPYEGAKVHYILDVEDHGLTERVLTLAEAATPVPKLRKKGRGEKLTVQGTAYAVPCFSISTGRSIVGGGVLDVPQTRLVMNSSHTRWFRCTLSSSSNWRLSRTSSVDHISRTD